MSHTQRLAGIGTLSAGAAHELVNPLSVITSTCSNLLYELEAESFDRELLTYYVDLVERNAFRIAQIVKVLQEYAHLDEPQIVVTDVDIILRDALALVEKQFLTQANIQIDVDMGRDIGSVVCDHNRLTQVLVNLLTNARDAIGSDGGKIQLRFWSILNKGERVSGGRQLSENGSGQFAFSVKDNGHGIQNDSMDHLFKPFFSTRANGQGLGLGLFIAKGIIEQHNGRIWAENNPAPQKGATFTVTLPSRPSF
ncbi:MAG: HAMP domain-containing sensor histidine kinase [Candidatus Promineifilaceae bacterium]|nr:HAMP domain-containing sensor histidine kinase [Candidatus Promineifilaceae bacterium]